MTKLLGTVDLVRGDTGVPEPAKIYVGLHRRHLSDQEKLWRPQLSSHRRLLISQCTNAQGQFDAARANKELARLGIGDEHWDWRQLNRDYRGDAGCLLIAIECSGRTQGLMLLESDIHVTRLQPKGQNLIYIDRVAVAPWNRKPLNPTQEFRGVGRLLVATAISVSIDKSYDGRIGLHSLPGAQSFYSGMCGMTDLGVDPMKKLNYFEMTETQATTFISRKAVQGTKP
jgi:hypothetical protein